MYPEGTTVERACEPRPPDNDHHYTYSVCWWNVWFLNLVQTNILLIFNRFQWVALQIDYLCILHRGRHTCKSRQIAHQPIKNVSRDMQNNLRWGEECSSSRKERFLLVNVFLWTANARLTTSRHFHKNHKRLQPFFCRIGYRNTFEDLSQPNHNWSQA